MSVNINNSGTLKRIAGGTLYADAPVGTIQAYGGAIDSTHQAPSGWLLCDGSEKNIDDFADLYAVIGDAFGTPSVNTKFVLPDLREATTKGAGLTGLSNNHYDSDGLALGEFIEDRVQEHTHRKNANWGNFTASYYPAGSDGQTGADAITFGNVYDARSGDTTEVKAVGVNYIIKAKQTALPVDLAEQVQPKTLDNSISIDGETKTTVESALSGFSSLLNLVNLAENYDLNNCITAICIKAWGTSATNIVNSLVNKPTLTYGAGECTVLYIPMSSAWGTQIFIGGNGDNVEVWRRRRKSNGWSAWAKWL